MSYRLRLATSNVLTCAALFTTLATSAGCASPVGPGGSAAAATNTGLTGANVARPSPRIETHASAGFRLYRAGYRLMGHGALVSVQICRLPFWAGPGPGYVRVETLDSAGAISESHQARPPRLGMRSGNNCASASLRLDRVPDYGDTVKLCTLRGNGSCP